MPRNLLPALAGTFLCAALQGHAAVTLFDFRFDEGPLGDAISSLVDSGPGGLDGTATGLTYAAAAAGAGGFAGNFNGATNFASIANDASMQAQEFTLSARVNPAASWGGAGNAAVAADGLVAIVTKKNGEAGNFLNSYALFYNVLEQRFLGQVSFVQGSGVTLVSSSRFAAGTWREVELSLDRDASGSADYLTLWVDGVLQADRIQVMPQITYTASGLLIGAANYGGSATGQFRRNYNGLIDDVRLVDTPIVVASPPPIPEPATWATLALGLGAVVAHSRRRVARIRHG
jgi:hypothetical protein